MKMLVKDLADKFRVLVGDDSSNVPDALIIQALNLAFNKLVSVPKLSRAFTKHYTVNLDAMDGYKWKLEGDFRRIADIPLLNFFSTGQGGDPCPLNICPLQVVPFYNKNGLPSLKKPGIPCEYTIEQEGDSTFLVLDRPSDVPLVVDYIAYGYPAPVYSMGDEIDISAVIEDLILNSMRDAFYTEAEDLAFAGAVLDMMSNKYIPEAIQMLNKGLGVMPAVILGEA